LLLLPRLDELLRVMDVVALCRACHPKRLVRFYLQKFTLVGQQQQQFLAEVVLLVFSNQLLVAFVFVLLA